MPSENFASISNVEPEVFVDAQDVPSANDSENIDGQGIYAASFLPEGVEMSGVAEVGHGLAEAPPTQSSTEAISGYDGAVQGAVTREFDLGDLALVPKEGEGEELDAQGSAMEHLIATTPEVTNLGNELNGVKKSDTGVTLETGAELAPNILNPEKDDMSTLELVPQLRILKEVPPDIATKFAELGWKAEDLATMEGFSELSRGQQKQVYENLSALVIGRIHEEAKDGAEEASKRARGDARFLGKMWIGMKESFGAKKIDTAAREKQLASDLEKGGMAMHKDVMEQLVGGMKKYGPEVEELPNGDIRPKFLSAEGLSNENAERIEAFNAQARSFSKVPYEWSLDTATKSQREKYSIEQLAFDMRKKEALSLISKEGGEGNAIGVMADIEGKLTMDRFMQTSPDAVRELQNIKKQSTWTRAISSTVAEKGAYMALGIATRSVLGATLGVACAPLAASVTGGLRGYFKAKESLREQDRSARQGKETQGGTEKTSKNMVEAGGEQGSVAKINLLMKRIDSIDQMLLSGPPADEVAMMEKKKLQLLAFLNQRLDYTQEKISEGKMIFGEAGERLSNQYEITSVLARGRAEVCAREEDISASGGEVYARTETLSGRITTLLEKTDEQTKDARTKMVVMQTAKAAALGAGFAAAGALGRDAFSWMRGSQESFLGKSVGSYDEVKAAALEKIAALKSGIEDGVGEIGARMASGFESIPGIAINEGAAVEWVETPSGLSALPEDIAPAELDAIWKESSTGLHKTEEDFITSESGVQALERSNVYEVKSGDTVTSILKAKFPGITNTQIENLRSQNLKDFGIQSGNLDKIGLSDKLDMNKLEEAIKNGKGTGSASLGLTGGASASSGGPGGTGGDMGGAKAALVYVPEPQGERAAEAVSPVKDVEKIVPTPKTEVIREAPTKAVVGELLTKDEQTAEIARSNYLKYPERRAQIAGVLGVSKAELDKQFGVTTQNAEARMTQVAQSREAAAQMRQERALSAQFDRETLAQERVELAQGAKLTREVEAQVRQTGVLKNQMVDVDRRYGEAVMRAGTQEEQSVARIQANYQREVERLTMAKEHATATQNVGSMNRGVRGIEGILQGRKVSVPGEIINEASRRTQGGITAENQYAQALQRAQVSAANQINQARLIAQAAEQNAEIAKASQMGRLQDQLDRLGPPRVSAVRAPAPESYKAEYIRPAPVAPAMPQSAPRVNSLDNLPGGVRNTNTVAEFDRTVGAETAQAAQREVPSVAQAPNLRNVGVPAEMQVKELRRHEIIELMKDRSVDEVLAMKKTTTNTNMLSLQGTLERIENERFPKLPGDKVGSLIQRYDAYRDRYGIMGQNPFIYLSGDRLTTVLSMTPEQVLADKGDTGKLNSVLTQAIQNYGFKPHDGETTQEFIKRYDDSFKSASFPYYTYKAP